MVSRLGWILAACALAVVAGCSRPGGTVHEVHVSARQFAFDPGEVRVRQGERVRLIITSADVTHGFSILEYSINRQVAPGQTVVVEFTADKPGRFPIYCSVFCGTGHAQHRGVLVVDAR